MRPPPRAAAPAAPAASRPPRPRGPAARRRAGPRPAPRGADRPAPRRPDLPAPRAPSATRTTRLQISASRSVFCSAIRIVAPSRGQASERIGHQAAAGGVQLRGRLVEHQQAGPQRQQARDGDQLLLPAGQARRIARRKRLDAERRQRLIGAPDDVVARQAEVHRSEGDLLVDRVGHPGELRRGLAKAIPMRPASWWMGSGAASSPSSSSGRSACRRRCAAPGRCHQAEGRLAGLRWRRPGQPPRRRAGPGSRRATTAASRRRSDS